MKKFVSGLAALSLAVGGIAVTASPAAAWSSADQRAWVCSWWKAIC